MQKEACARSLARSLVCNHVCIDANSIQCCEIFNVYTHNTIRQKQKRYAHDAATLSTVSATGTVFDYTVALKSRITICCYIQARIKRTHGSCNDHGQITLNLLKFTILRIVMVVAIATAAIKLPDPEPTANYFQFFKANHFRISYMHKSNWWKYTLIQ